MDVGIALFNASADGTSIVYFDAVQAVNSTYDFPYRDGDMSGCSWSGTAHNSTTTVTGSLLKYSNPLSVYKGSLGGWIKVTDNLSVGGQMLFSLGDANAEFDAYLHPTVEQLRFTKGGTTAASTTAPTAGTWFFIGVSWDFSAGEIIYTLNGEQVGSTVSYTTLLDFSTHAGILCSDNLSSTYSTNGYGADWFLRDEAMTVLDFKAIYESNAPVFAETSTQEFFTVSDDGAKVWLDETGIYAQDDDGLPSFALVNTDGKSWNGETLNTRDVLLGDNSTGKANILFDASAGTFSIRGGTTEQVTISADGSLQADNVRLSSNGSETMMIPNTMQYALSMPTTYGGIPFHYISGMSTGSIPRNLTISASNGAQTIRTVS